MVRFIKFEIKNTKINHNTYYIIVINRYGGNTTTRHSKLKYRLIRSRRKNIGAIQFIYKYNT